MSILVGTSRFKKWILRCKDRPSYKDAHDASSEPSILSLSTICSKILISFVFDKSITDGRMDRQIEGRTDRLGYRDARVHIKMIVMFRTVYGLENCVFMVPSHGATSGLSLSAVFTLF